MTREDIKNAAMEFAYKTGETDFKAFSKGFFNGVRWRINSVWHDREVIPEFIEKELLIMFCDNSCMIISIASHWCDFLENNKFVKWAYLEDILPIK